MKSLWFLAINLIFSLHCLAAVQVTLVNGTQEERLALNLLGNIATLFNAARQNIVQLNLTDLEQSLLQDILHNPKASTKMLEIEIIEANRSGKVIYDPLFPNKFAITRNNFYNRTSNIRSFQYIFKELAQAWLSHPKLYYSDRTEVNSLIDKLMPLVELKTNKIKANKTIDLISSNIYINKKFTTSVLSVSDNVQNYELNSLINREIPCKADVAEIVKIQESTVVRNKVFSRLTYTCNKNVYSADIQFNLPQTLTSTQIRKIKLKIKNHRKWANCSRILTNIYY